MAFNLSQLLQLSTTILLRRVKEMGMLINIKSLMNEKEWSLTYKMTRNQRSFNKLVLIKLINKQINTRLKIMKL
jgi:hypothetical protein